MDVRREWARWLRVVHPVVLLVALWMVSDKHHTAAMVLLIASIAVLLSAITLEHEP